MSKAKLLSLIGLIILPKSSRIFILMLRRLNKLGLKSAFLSLVILGSVQYWPPLHKSTKCDMRFKSSLNSARLNLLNPYK